MLSPLARTIQEFRTQFPGEPVPKDPEALIAKINADYPAMPRALTQGIGGLVRVLRGEQGASIVDRIERDLATAETPVTRRHWFTGFGRAFSEGIAGKPAGGGGGGGAFAGALLAQRLQAQVPTTFAGRNPLEGARYQASKGDTGMTTTVLAFAWENGTAGPKEVTQVLQQNYQAVVTEHLDKARLEAGIGRVGETEGHLATASFYAGRASMDVRAEVGEILRLAAQVQFDGHFESIAIALADGRDKEAGIALTRAAYAEQMYNTLIAPLKVEWPSDVPRPSA